MNDHHTPEPGRYASAGLLAARGAALLAASAATRAAATLARIRGRARAREAQRATSRQLVQHERRVRLRSAKGAR